MQTVTRNEVKQAVEDAATEVVEVLDQEQFEEFHLPGAINIPFGDDFDKRIQERIPEKQRRIIVYCQDADCPASEKAAKRMDELGYDNVLEYEGGKMDWKQAGLPIEN